MKTNIKRLFSLICALGVLLTMCACGTVEEITATTQEQTTQATETQAPVTVAEDCNPLTGEIGYDEKYDNIRPVAIVVENTPQARPQWGTGSADICIEYEVEGGISRMLWLYANVDEIPEKVGPVRSARHDAQELTLGFDAIFVCWGKSFLATNAAQSEYTIDEINGMVSASYFAKDTSRQVATEHQGFTTGANLVQAIADKGIRTAITDGYYGIFNFAPDGSPTVLEASGVSSRVFFSSSYNHDFIYNAETRLYTNTMSGKTMTDENGNADEYTNVITLFVDSETLPTEHVDLKLENGGSGTLVTNGSCASVKWSKGIYSDRLTVTYEDGSPVMLNAGRTYIGFVRSTLAASNTVE